MWRRVVVLTGCDGGLGYRFALEAANSGLTVVAGFLGGGDAPAARLMQSQLPAKSAPLHTLGLDVTDDTSVANAADYVADLLAADKDYCLHAVVNNAGVMIFGEFEWQTMDQMHRQLDVNLVGTWRVSKAFAPMLRRTAAAGTVDTLRPRLIVVGSHCAIQPLPLLSVYAASKSASSAWCEAVRMELKPFGVDVVNFIPGSFVASTNIMSDQNEHIDEMRAAFDEELTSSHAANVDTIQKFFERISSREPKSPDSVRDAALVDKFKSAVLDKRPRHEYKLQPWRYAIYHFLFGVSPIAMRHWLVWKFVGFPKFTYKKN